jgi:serine protease Do
LISKQRSSGSGVLLSADGYIVTNGHVVQGARRVQVQLSYALDKTLPHSSAVKPRGKMIEGKVVGVDRDTDLAVLKIDRTELPHLTLGDSDAVKQGQLVLAFGNPLGLQNSVTLGIVSSTARQLKPEDPMIYIQTDAPINPGNSGGPLLDADGRVVGINTFILSQSGGSEGIGFSIPSNIVRNVYRQIRKDGHVHRGHIGVFAQTITPELAAGLSLGQEWGVLLADVAPEGPAAEAGLEVGDIVLKMNGKALENARQMEVNLYRSPLSEKVRLEILRGPEKLTFQVPVIERDDDPQRFADMVSPEVNMIGRLGILGIQIDKKIVAMLPDLRKKYGIVVAARASEGNGLHAGDVIYAVNTVPTATIEGLRKALEDLKPGDPAVIQVERDGKLMFIVLDLE